MKLALTPADARALQRILTSRWINDLLDDNTRLVAKRIATALRKVVKAKA